MRWSVPGERRLTELAGQPSTDGARPAFKRVLLKLSGEALMGNAEYGADAARIAAIAAEVQRVCQRGVEVAIVAAGTGNPFFTTDTAAALRALEIHAEAILMAKNGVEGVFDADPRVEPAAQFLPEITHREAIERRLAVMDSTALSLCMDNNL